MESPAINGEDHEEYGTKDKKFLRMLTMPYDSSEYSASTNPRLI
jgi:hypothetical protein